MEASIELISYFSIENHNLNYEGAQLVLLVIHRAAGLPWGSCENCISRRELPEKASQITATHSVHAVGQAAL